MNQFNHVQDVGVASGGDLEKGVGSKVKVTAGGRWLKDGTTKQAVEEGVV